MTLGDMTLGNTVNRVARRLGVQVVRTDTLESLRASTAPPSPRRGRRPTGSGPRAASPRRRTALPRDYEPEFVEIWNQVKDRTMTPHEKGYYLHHAVKYVERHAIPGAIVECGVWRGGSMLNVALTLLSIPSVERELYLFDTFAGMSEPTERDARVATQEAASEVLERAERDTNVWAVASLEDVKAGFADVPYPAERLHFVQGMVEDTIPGEAPERIAVLRLDTDWYESTRHEFEHLYSRLSPGGVLIIDDYGTWQGSRDATDEFLEKTGEPLLLVRTAAGRAAVKPGLTSRVD